MRGWGDRVIGGHGDEGRETSNYGLRPEPCEVQGCHEPYVVHGGMRNK